MLQGEFLESLLRDDEAPPRVAIYRRNVLAALSGALEAAYPVTLRLVGAAFFLEAARTFARATPSTSGDLHAYGGEFPEFLSGYSPARVPREFARRRRWWIRFRGAGARAARA